MNMISRLRQRVKANGSATISISEYNQLQEEWIRRCGIIMTQEQATELSNETIASTIPCVAKPHEVMHDEIQPIDCTIGSIFIK